jgi:hypothetical protein
MQAFIMIVYPIVVIDIFKELSGHVWLLVSALF